MKICICWQIEVTTKEQKKWQRKPNVGGKDIGEMYLIQHYVIKFVSDLRQVSGFLRVL
jgi:hypothetical protein